MSPEQLNHYLLMETENKLLIRHNKELMSENELLKFKLDKLSEEFLKYKNNRRRKGKL